MGKKIINNTLTFFLILGFVKGFATVFGEGNTLVGVTIIIAVLVLMSRDLTKNPWKNLGELIFLNVISGIFAYISSNNMWLGLILNFLTLSGIGYFLSFNLNKTIIVPFGLQYLFMLYTPVEGKDFTLRLVALVVGAFLIMGVQLVLHRKKKEIRLKESEILQFEEEVEKYKKVSIFGYDFNIHKVRGSYAVRIGLVASFSAFIVGYFNLEQGRWIVYTIFSLTELYSEHCKVRSLHRIQGTIIGAVIIFTLFLFIKDNTLRGLLVLVGGYLDSYTSNYRDKIICVTISVVASVSLTEGTLNIAIQRIGYVFLGVVLALIVNRFVLQQRQGVISA